MASPEDSGFAGEAAGLFMLRLARENATAERLAGGTKSSPFSISRLNGGRPGC
jgi:hypothetical protein